LWILFVVLTDGIQLQNEHKYKELGNNRENNGHSIRRCDYPFWR